MGEQIKIEKTFKNIEWKQNQIKRILCPLQSISMPKASNLIVT